MFRFRIVDLFIVVLFVSYLLGLARTIQSLRAYDSGLEGYIYDELVVSPNGETIAVLHANGLSISLFDAELQSKHHFNIQELISHGSNDDNISLLYFSGPKTLTIQIDYQKGSRIFDIECESLQVKERIRFEFGYELTGNKWVVEDLRSDGTIQVYGMDQQFHKLISLGDSLGNGLLSDHAIPIESSKYVYFSVGDSVWEDFLWDLTNDRLVWADRSVTAISPTTRFVARYEESKPWRLSIKDTLNKNRWIFDRTFRVVDFSNDERFVAMLRYRRNNAGSTSIAIFDTETGEQLGNVPQSGLANGEFIPGTDRIAFICSTDEGFKDIGETIELWNWRTGQKIHQIGKRRWVWGYVYLFSFTWIFMIGCRHFLRKNRNLTSRPKRIHQLLDLVTLMIATIVVLEMNRLIFTRITTNAYDHGFVQLMIAFPFFSATLFAIVDENANRVVKIFQTLMQIGFLWGLVLLVQKYDNGQFFDWVVAAVGMLVACLIAGLGIDWLWTRKPAHVVDDFGLASPTNSN